MSAVVALIIVTTILFALLAIETPVAFALAASGLVGATLILDVHRATSTAASVPYAATARSGLIIIPMFILMGLLVSHSGLATDIFSLARHVVGERIPGSLAVATIMACAGFAAVTGSSVATVATVGRIGITEMRRHGYSSRVAAGVVGAAGTLGILIPPSIVLVIYGVITEESIGRLLLAGIIPGVLSAIVYTVYIMALVRINPDTITATDVQSHSTAGLAQSITVVGTVGGLFILVVGGIYGGFFTPTEAGAIGAFGALIVLLARLARSPKELWRSLVDALHETAALNSMIFMLLLGGAIFTFFLVVSATPARFTEWVLGLPIPPTAIVVLILLAMVPLGMILDGMSIMLITLPLAYPVIINLGFDGIWFGVLVIKMIEIGLITPPLGINIYVVAGVQKDLTVEQVFRGVAPFVVVDLATVAVLFLIPGLVTWLPNSV